MFNTYNFIKLMIGVVDYFVPRYFPKTNERLHNLNQKLEAKLS